MTTESAGISDEVTAELSGPGRETKRAADVYIQVIPDGKKKWTFRVVDRTGQIVKSASGGTYKNRRELQAAIKQAAAKVAADDMTVQVETYPGASGGPRLPEPEGDTK